MKYISALILIFILLTSCENDVLPKPTAYLSLKYPENSYSEMLSDCPYSFEISKYATVEINEDCWAKIEYPSLKATVHVTYRGVSNNLEEILKEVEKLTFEHTIKADAISDLTFENFENRVFAKIYNVEGNVATNIQFRATDSINHVLAGALYFDVKPNYDSIYPASEYLKKDIKRIMETIRWKNK